MKRIDIFCASQASTAICLSMDQASSSSASSSTIQLGGRAIDRHNPIIRDCRRFTRPIPSNPCVSQPPPIDPTPYHQLQKSKKGHSKKRNDQAKKSTPSSVADKNKKSTSLKQTDIVTKKSYLDPKDHKESGRKSWGKPVDLFTPPGSSRYLLSDTAIFDGISDYNPVLSLVPAQPKKPPQSSKQDDCSINASKPSSSSRSDKPSSDQVVVLRVSLHCKGCEGKVRKHLSRMEGVTSFNIDFAAKKVTIIGNVTPLGVLASVSKVKNAQFWPVAMSSYPAPAPALPSSNLATKK